MGKRSAHPLVNPGTLSNKVWLAAIYQNPGFLDMLYPLSNLQGDQINVRDFGAVGDGATDDTDALNAAFDRIRALQSTSIVAKKWSPSLIIPAGIYKCGGSVNATGINSINWTIHGNGAILYGTCTGKPVLDALGSRFFTWYDLNIYGDATNKPTYGIQHGRNSTASVGDCSMHNVNVWGNFTKACLYNYAAETVLHTHLHLFNDESTSDSYALVHDAGNYEDIDSEFITQSNAQGTAASFNEQLFLSADIRKANGGTPIRFRGSNCARHHFVNSYGVSVDGPIVELNNCASIRDLWLDMHAETLASTEFLMIDNVNPSQDIRVQKLLIRDHATQVSNSLIDVTGSTRKVYLDDMTLDLGDPHVSTPDIFGAGAADASKIVASGTIKWSSDNALVMDQGIFSGDIFTREGITITAHANSAYRKIIRPAAAADAGNHFVGNVSMNNLPTSDPAIVGHLWNDSGTLKVSAG